MSARAHRLTGVALLLTALAVLLGALLGDPLIESHDDRERFVEQVESAADRVPVVYAFQIVEVGSGLLTLAAGIGLYLLLRDAHASQRWQACCCSPSRAGSAGSDSVRARCSSSRRWQ